MSLTILEVLENASYNLQNMHSPAIQLPMAKEQLKNAIKLLNDGKDLYDEFKEEDLTEDSNGK